MARQKNTAEAFEVILRLAQEKKQAEGAGHSGNAVAPQSSAGSAAGPPTPGGTGGLGGERAGGPAQGGTVAPDGAGATPSSVAPRRGPGLSDSPASGATLQREPLLKAQGLGGSAGQFRSTSGSGLRGLLGRALPADTRAPGPGTRQRSRHEASPGAERERRANLSRWLGLPPSVIQRGTSSAPAPATEGRDPSALTGTADRLDPAVPAPAPRGARAGLAPRREPPERIEDRGFELRSRGAAEEGWVTEDERDALLAPVQDARSRARGMLGGTSAIPPVSEEAADAAQVEQEERILEEQQDPLLKPSVDPVLLRRRQRAGAREPIGIHCLEAKEPPPGRRRLSPAVEEEAYEASTGSGEGAAGGGSRGGPRSRPGGAAPRDRATPRSAGGGARPRDGGARDPRGSVDDPRPEREQGDVDAEDRRSGHGPSAVPSTNAAIGSEAVGPAEPVAAQPVAPSPAIIPSPTLPRGSRREPARDAAPLQESPIAASSPAPLTSRDVTPERAAPFEREVRLLVRKAAEWVLGPTASLSLDRRLEIRVSTILGIGMASVVIVLLVVMYIGIQTGGWGRTGPRLPDPFTAAGSGEAGTGARPGSDGAGVVADPPQRAGEAPALAVTAGRGADGAVEGGALGGGPGTKLPGVSRPLPLWSPPQDPQPDGVDGAPGGGAAGAALLGGDPELRNVQVRASDPQDGQAGAQEGTQDSAVESPPPSPYVYRIQVRAQESQEGAQRIAEYFRELGFEEHQIEGDRGAGGTRDYTVFIGKFYDPAEADRGCEKLRKLARTKPYLNGRTYFQDSFVVRRERS